MTDGIEFEVSRVDRTVVEPEDEPPYPIVHVFGYDSDGGYHHEQVLGFEPYCYAPFEEVKEADLDSMPFVKRGELYDEDGNEFRSVRGERVVRIVTYVPGQVPDVDDEFSKTWESDVLFPQRFIIDKGMFNGIRVPDSSGPCHAADVEPCEHDGEWRTHVMDIEVEDRGGFPEDGTEPVLCITAYDSFLDEYITWLQGEGEGEEYTTESELHDADVSVRWFDDEAAMLRDYISFLNGSRPAVITGWNIDDFDIPYLIDRCEVLEDDSEEDINIDAISPLHSVRYNNYGPSIKGVNALDLLLTFKRRERQESDSYRLEAIGQQELGVGKEIFAGKVGKLWEDDPVKLLDYNLRDVELCVELDRRQDLIGFARDVKAFGGCQLEDAPIESTVCDRYVLRARYGKDVLPRMSAGSGKEFEGADVFDAFDGIAELVPFLDVKSLYPMSMVTLNASPETKVDPERFDGPTRHSPNGIHFRTDQTAIITEIVDELLEEREERKRLRDEHESGTDEYEKYDSQQAAVKVIMNALYGVMGWSRFRLYDVDVASAVTATGRAVLSHSRSVTERNGRKVLYGDTDGFVVDLNADVTEEGAILMAESLERQINESYDEFAAETLNADTHRFEIEFEKLYRRFFQGGSKKRYAGFLSYKDGKEVEELEITGYQYKRSDATELGSRVQKEALRRIVTGEDPDDVASYMSEQIAAFNRFEFELGAIGKPTGLGKRLNRYDADTHNARGAKFGNLILGTSFAKGAKPRRYYLEDVNRALFDRLEEEEGFDPGRDRVYAQFKEDPWVIAVDRAEQLAPELVFDFERMLTKNLYEPMNGIMESLGYEWEELESGQRQAAAVGDDD